MKTPVKATLIAAAIAVTPSAAACARKRVALPGP